MPADVFELHKRRRAAELWRVRLVVIPRSLATCTGCAVPDVSQLLALAVAFALLAVEGPVWLRAVPDGRLRAIATWARALLPGWVSLGHRCTHTRALGDGE